MTSLNEELLAEDPDSSSVEADEDFFYAPDQSDSSVVVTEPEVITIGRGKRKEALRKERNGEV